MSAFGNLSGSFDFHMLSFDNAANQLNRYLALTEAYRTRGSCAAALRELTNYAQMLGNMQADSRSIPPGRIEGRLESATEKFNDVASKTIAACARRK